MKTTDAAKGRWFWILADVGIDTNYLRDKHGPCPLCAGKDRFRWHDKGGEGGYYCNQCGPGFGIDLYMAWTGKDFKESAKAIDAAISNIPTAMPVEDEAAKAEKARVRLKKIQSELLSIDGINPVSLYLKSRKLKSSPALRLHPGMPYYEQGDFLGRFPSMVVPFKSPEGKPLTFHVTYLTKSGEKAPVTAAKKVITPTAGLAGGAIRLFPAAPVMGIAEGIETALAASERFQIPVWAAYSAVLLERFVPPTGVKTLHIFGDNDASYTGQKASYNLANRLHQHHEVLVSLPTEVGTDFADEVSA